MALLPGRTRLVHEPGVLRQVRRLLARRGQQRLRRSDLRRGEAAGRRFVRRLRHGPDCTEGSERLRSVGELFQALESVLGEALDLRRAALVRASPRWRSGESRGRRGYRPRLWVSHA